MSHRKIKLITVTSAVVALGGMASSYAQDQARTPAAQTMPSKTAAQPARTPAAQTMPSNTVPQPFNRVAPQPVVPAEQGKTGDRVAYVSGGVGDDSSDRMASMSREYNMKLMFTLNEGNYLSDVHVAVTDSRGGKVIDDMANGPFFFAKLPPGQYTVTATHEGKSQTRKMNVGKGMQSAHLRWASTPEDFPGPRDGHAKTSDKVMVVR